MSQSELLKTVVGVLERESIDYMLTGSIVSGLQGFPRLTHDIDIVVRFPLTKCAQVPTWFPEPDYYADGEAARQAVISGGMFNIISIRTGDKVDFWVLRREEYDLEAFGRRVEVQMADQKVMVPRPEDTILSKLRWCRMSGRSEKQLADVVGVLKVQGAAIDRAYIERWATELGVVALWREAHAAANRGQCS